MPMLAATQGPHTQGRGLFVLGDTAIIGAVLWSPIVRRLAPFVVAADCLTVMVGSSGAQTVATVSDPAGGGSGGLAPPQVAVIGRRMFQTLASTGTPTVTVFATTWSRAETILLGLPPAAVPCRPYGGRADHPAWSPAAAGPAGRPRPGATGSVVGADISVPLVGVATQRARDRGAANVRFVVADVQREGIDGAPFTAAVSQFGVMFFDEPVVAFANIRAQLGPGGRLAFACWQPPAKNPWFVGPSLAPFVAPPLPPAAGKSPTGPFSLADPDHTTSILAAAGWSAIQRTAHERTVTVDSDAIVDDGQLTFLGVSDRDFGVARIAVRDHLADLERDDGRYNAPLAFQVFTATR